MGYVSFLKIDIGNDIIERNTMAKKDMHSFKKYQKELKRKEKANEKLARRQGRKDKTLKDSEGQDIAIDKMDSF
jgi:hypothetical protein